MHPVDDAPALIVLFFVGAIASAINAVAGAGSLLSYPTLVAFGLPPITANATNFVALLPGRVSSFWAFRGDYGHIRPYVRFLMAPSLVGAGCGAWLLVETDERLFRQVVPWLILLATVMLAIQPIVKRWAKANDRRIGPTGSVLLQFFTAVYGGYFGAGIGIMMLATFAMIVEGTLHQQNALKILFAFVISLTAAGTVLYHGRVDAWAAGVMVLGGLVGGFYAGAWMRKLDERRLRGVIVALGFLLTGYYGWQEYVVR